VLFGGERVSIGHVRRAFAALGPGRLIHVYGPTETTVFATSHAIDSISDDADTIPIGRPLSNTRVYVLDRGLRPVPVGVPGALYIGGDGTAIGYLNQPDLTARQFVADPFTHGQRLYASGDVVRWLADGTIEFLGREDDQVKIRGFRVEPGEVAGALLALPEIREAIVVPRHDGEPRLCAYVVPHGDVEASALREALSRTLPEQMIPADFVVLDSLPLNANGKIDLKALPDPATAGERRRSTYVQPTSDLERTLCEIWEEALRVRPVGIHDNFFELGGHSLKATQIVSAIYQRLHVKLELKTMFTDPTVAEIAARIEAIEWASGGPADPDGSVASDLILQ
jgi:acyl-CoA synthetase (AMP-forming)/AMP-acid ligase II/acyl carrier protein